MKKALKGIGKFIGIWVLIYLFGIGLFGGFVYVFFPREDNIGDNSIIKTCAEAGGTPTWVEWQLGCKKDGKDTECYTEMCIVNPKN